MLIVGGGYIACEFACILNGLGIEVTQWSTAARRSCAASTTRRAAMSPTLMREQGVDLHLGRDV